MNDMNGSVRIVISDAGYEVPIENRPLWRLLMLCLCIKLLSSDGIGLPTAKIRAGSWMVLRPARWHEYKDFLFGYSDESPKVMPDSNVDRAIQIGIAKGYFSMSNSGRIELMSMGQSLIELAEKADVASAEREFLQDIKSKLTDKVVKFIIWG